MNQRLEYYTALDLKQWLEYNKPAKGLCADIIDPIRAYAILNNPYMTDNTPVLSVLFVNDVWVAYTAVFPELFTKPNNDKVSYCFSTLYCKPEYEGFGYGLCVVAQMIELLGAENCYDYDGAPETAAILKHEGLVIDYVPSYALHDKAFNKKSIKGLAAWTFNSVKQCYSSKRHLLVNDIEKANYSLEYIRFIDDQVYDFILSHSDEHIYIRKQETLNWILTYPFMVETPINARIILNCKFSSNIEQHKTYAVKVYTDSELIGVYVICASAISFSIKYLYYNEKYISDVFLSIAEHILKTKSKCVETTSEVLANFLAKYKLFMKVEIRYKSFAHPEQIKYDSSCFIQAGDGDGFVI